MEKSQTMRESDSENLHQNINAPQSGHHAGQISQDMQKSLERLRQDMSEEALWQTIICFQNYPFETYSGLPYTYTLKTGRNGEYNKELIISRRKQSKTLTWSSVRLAFRNASDMQGQLIPKPKALGDIRGISYIYPLFERFGIIETARIFSTFPHSYHIRQ